MAIATLTIDMVAKVANIERDMGKAARIAETNAKKMEKAFDAAGKAFAALGVGVSVGAFSAMVRNVAQSAEEVGRLSQVANAGAEEFQRLAYGAETAGVSNEKFADILKDVNDKVGEFVAVGGGPLKDFFDNIAPQVGVTADQFARLSGPEALQLYFDSLQKANLSQQQMTFYMEALASDATALIPLLRDGGRGFRTMGDEAERFGGVMSGDLIRSSKEFNQNLQRLETLARGVAIGISNEIIPALNDLIEDMVEGTRIAGGFFEAIKLFGATNPFDTPAEALTKYRKELAELNGDLARYQKFGGDTSGIETAIAAVTKKLEYAKLQQRQAALSLSRDPAADALELRRLGLDGRSTAGASGSAGKPAKTAKGKKAKEDDPLADALADIESRIKPAEQAIERFRQVQLDAAVSGAELTKSERMFYDLINDPAWSAMPEPWQDLARAQFEAANAAEKSAAEQARLNALLEATPTAQLDKQRETMQFLADAYERGRINAEQFGEAANAALGNVAPEAQEATDAMSVFADQAARNMQDAFADFLFDPFDKGLKGMVASFGQALQRMAADATAAAVFESIFGKQSGSGGSGSNAQTATSFFTAIAAFFADGGVMTSAGPVALRKYSGGGVASSPQLAMFGEGATPEAYVPLPDGRTIPVTMKGGSGGGVVLNQTFNFNGQADQQQVRMAAGAGARQALGALSEARRYG